MISFNCVTLGYGNKKVMENINFAIHDNDYLAIVGPNGCGKTTVLRALLRIIRPQKGKINYPNNLSIGYVPQRETLDTLYPLNALDVVLMGMYRKIGLVRRPNTQHYSQAIAALARVKLEQKAYSPFRDLSGGQRQRVIIARALSSAPDLLVLDEPLNGMDIVGSKEILTLLSDLHQQNITIVIVTHDLKIVAEHVDRIAIISENGEWHTGNKADIVNNTILSKIYRVPIEVTQYQGKYTIDVKVAKEK